MIYALPYLLLVCLYGTLAVFYHRSEDDKTRLYLEIASIGIFIFFFGFRGFVFFDWTMYYQHFYNIPDFRTLMTMDVSKWATNPGYVLLNVACRAVVPNYHFFVFVCTSICAILLMRFFNKYTDNIPLSFMLMLSINGIMTFTDLMRNSLSILLFLNSLQYLYERKPLQYFAINLLGLTFHTTAIIALPLYFFLHRRINRWILLGLFLAANTMYLMHVPILKTLIGLVADIVAPSLKSWLEDYTTMDKDAGFNLGIGYERIITALLLFFFIDKLRDMRKENDIFINSTYLYLILFLVFSEFTSVSLRLSTLFSFGYWVIWGDLIKCFEFKSNRHLFALFLGVYCLMRTYSATNMQLAEYENILISAKPYNERILEFRQHFNDKR